MVANNLAQAVRAPTLAIDGGTPVRTSPFPSWPQFTEDEIEAVTQVLRSGKINYWTGNECREFEAEFAEVCETTHAISVANGSLGLELALRACGIGPGDEVIVTPRSFIASVTCVMLLGAKPVFADLDPVTQNISPQTIREVLTPRTRAVVPVHLGGWPCDMEGICELAAEHSLKVIEDCAQALGSRIQGRPVGAFGHVGVFSFCQDKIITTGGEGGMVVTKDAELWSHMWSFKDHGKSFDTVNAKHPPGFRWLHESVGSNYRMTEMQAALGRSLLRKLPEIVARRQSNARLLDACLLSQPAIRTTIPPAEIEHSYYRYYAFIRPDKLKSGWSRDRVMLAIGAEGIPCFSGSCSEIYLEKAIPESLRPSERLPVAQELGDTSLMFFVHQKLTDSEIQDTCRAVEKVLQEATL